MLKMTEIITESQIKLRSALTHMKVFADDDHDGDMRENVIEIFNSLTKQEKIAILENVLDTHFTNADAEDFVVQNNLQILEMKDKMKSIENARMFKLIIFASVFIIILTYSLYFLIKTIGPDNLNGIIETVSEVTSVMLGIDSK
jgi:hypothetical protein